MQDSKYSNYINEMSLVTVRLSTGYIAKWYELSVTGYIGDARNSLIDCNEIKFTTTHSIVNGINSAVSNKVVWWYVLVMPPI